MVGDLIERRRGGVPVGPVVQPVAEAVGHDRPDLGLGTGQPGESPETPSRPAAR